MNVRKMSVALIFFSGNARSHSSAFFGQGSTDMPIWLENVECDGNEDNIERCRSSGIVQMELLKMVS